MIYFAITLLIIISQNNLLHCMQKENNQEEQEICITGSNLFNTYKDNKNLRKRLSYSKKEPVKAFLEHTEDEIVPSEVVDKFKNQLDEHYQEQNKKIKSEISEKWSKNHYSEKLVCKCSTIIGLTQGAVGIIITGGTYLYTGDVLLTLLAGGITLAPAPLTCIIPRLIQRCRKKIYFKNKTKQNEKFKNLKKARDGLQK